MTAEELARRMAAKAIGEWRVGSLHEPLLSYAEALLGMREALRKAHEWSSAFPPDGTASHFDHRAAFHVFAAADTALDAANALLTPLGVGEK